MTIRPLRKHRQQLLERLFAFADRDDIGAGGEVFIGVVRRIRTTHHDASAGRARHRDHPEHVALGHHVDREANDRRTHTLHALVEVFDAAERPVEDTDVEPFGLEVRRQIEHAERRMRPHDALLFAIRRQKVAVRQQDVHHDTCSGRRTSSTSAFSTGNAYQSRSQRQREAARSGQRHFPGCQAWRV